MLSRRLFLKRAAQTIGLISASCIDPSFVEQYVDNLAIHTLEATIRYPEQGWKHIAISRSVSKCAFYINGHQVTKKEFNKEVPGIQLPENVSMGDIKVEDVITVPFTCVSHDTNTLDVLNINELKVQDFS